MLSAFSDDLGFARVATKGQIADQGHGPSIPLYVHRPGANGQEHDGRTLAETWAEWEQSGRFFWLEMDSLVDMLDELVLRE